MKQTLFAVRIVDSLFVRTAEKPFVAHDTLSIVTVDERDDRGHDVRVVSDIRIV
jgi:hypothetical protein